jgi:hypothetical protein
MAMTTDYLQLRPVPNADWWHKEAALFNHKNFLFKKRAKK